MCANMSDKKKQKSHQDCVVVSAVTKIQHALLSCMLNSLACVH